ncbi:60S ribosomal protein L6, partial [Galemys pyrenaicus]
MTGEKAEKTVTKVKKSEAKKADAGREVRKAKIKIPKKGEPHCSGNPVLVRGVGRYSYRYVFHKGHLNPRLKRRMRTFLGMSQNQLVIRTIVHKWLNFPKCQHIIYPIDDVPQELLSQGKTPQSAYKTASCIAPRSILTILAEQQRHKGIFLEQQGSGLLFGTLEMCHCHLHQNWYQWCENAKMSLMLTSRSDSYVSLNAKKVRFTTEKKREITEQRKVYRKAVDSNSVNKA